MPSAKRGLQSFRAVGREVVFTESFGLLDIVFFLLAVATAFSVASGRTGA